MWNLYALLWKLVVLCVVFVKVDFYLLKKNQRTLQTVNVVAVSLYTALNERIGNGRGTKEKKKWGRIEYVLIVHQMMERMMNEQTISCSALCFTVLCRTVLCIEIICSFNEVK